MEGIVVALTIRLAVKDLAILIDAARRAVVFEGHSEYEAVNIVIDGDIQSALKHVLLPFPDIIPGVNIIDVTTESLYQ